MHNTLAGLLTSPDNPVDTCRQAILLVKNNQGYSEFYKIITSRKLNDDFSLTEVINTYNNNLFVLTQ